MANYDFEHDLEEGQRFERAVLEIINKDKLQYEANRAYPNGNKETRKLYDLYREGTTWEVKLDLRSKETGNVFFEMFDGQGGKSGMLVTEADYIIYGIWNGDEFGIYEIAYPNLIRLIFIQEGFWSVNAGDYSQTQGLCVEAGKLLCRDAFKQIGVFYENER